MTRTKLTCLAFVFAPLFATSGWTAEGEDPMNTVFLGTASDVDLSEFVWKNRPIIVFADSENDPAFVEQMTLLTAREDALKDRDVVVLTDTDPETLSDIRKKLRPRGFMMVIIGKDGGVKLRKPFPWSVREVSRTIDKMPMRQREIRDSAIGG